MASACGDATQTVTRDCCAKHRMNGSPNEEGKAGQDNEQPP
jgi:hypothetical protein